MVSGDGCGPHSGGAPGTEGVGAGLLLTPHPEGSGRPRRVTCPHCRQRRGQGEGPCAGLWRNVPTERTARSGHQVRNSEGGASASRSPQMLGWGQPPPAAGSRGSGDLREPREPSGRLHFSTGPTQSLSDPRPRPPPPTSEAPSTGSPHPCPRPAASRSPPGVGRAGHVRASSEPLRIRDLLAGGGRGSCGGIPLGGRFPREATDPLESSVS